MNPLDAAFEALASSLDATDEPSLGLILTLLHQKKFSGAITLHCYHGEVQFVELGKPIRIDLVRGRRKSGAGSRGTAPDSSLTSSPDLVHSPG